MKHESDDECPCGPTPAFDENEIVMLHHSLDGREMLEGRTHEGTMEHYHFLRERHERLRGEQPSWMTRIAKFLQR